MEAYFDNSATTRCFEEVKDIVVKTMMEDFGNPSAMHQKGVDAEGYVKESARTLAQILKVTEKEILFTSGGTESNNLALIGGALANKRSGNHIITTAVEHAAVSQPVAFLQEQGFEVTILPVDGHGVVKLDALEKALRPDTILVSTMMVNNETGAVMPVEKIGAMIQEKCPKALYHVDAIQAYGKMNIYPKRMGIDLLSVSGHKIHGPKGTGFLYVGDKVKIHPYIHGGGQQQGMRSGTENVPGIAGLSLAAEKMYANLEENRKHLYELKQYFVSHIGEVDGAVVNACDASAVEETAPHIVSVSFDGVRSEVLLHALEEKEIYVSSGSACSSNHPGISGTLKAIGVANERLDCTLRFSFSVETQIEQLKQTITELKQLVPVLARYTRR